MHGRAESVLSSSLWSIGTDRYPKMIKPESVNRDLVQNVDFAQTMLDLAGILAPDFMQGKSLKPILQGNTPDAWRESVYYRYWMHLAHFNIPAHIGVRTKDYKLIYYYGRAMDCPFTIDEPTMPEWELFDLNADPMEMNNVYFNTKYADIIVELKTELKKLRVECDDDDFDFDEVLNKR
jgi:arylsulfatase A-like enzyme